MDTQGDDDLAERLALARAAWPGVGLDAQAFARHLAAHAGGGAHPSPRELAPDVYIAWAAGAGDEAALRAVDSMIAELASWAARRLDRGAAFGADVAQTLRERLLVGAEPRIMEYAGRAPLRSFLSTAAMRIALDMRRGRAEEPHAHLDSSAGGAAAVDPELVFLRERYRVHFQAAVQAALAGLPAKDRAILRLHLGQRLGIDKLAVVYDVGRSTAHRWLERARERLVESTRAALCSRLNVTPSEYESLAALVRSDVAVSIVRLLESEGGTNVSG